MRRLFVGVPVSLTTVDGLSGAAESLARRAQAAQVRIRWLPPATYHVTLKFLGGCRDEVVDAVVDGLRRAAGAGEPPRFTTARLGAFPSTRRATVVWAGIRDPDDRLARLAARVEAEMAALGFAAEDRPFHPHVTIGRLREPADVSDVILPLAEQVFSETRVHDLVLYESVTKSTGSEYGAIARVPVAGPKRQTSGLELTHGQQGRDPDPDLDPDAP
jgi:RNA 2',3'-cyclic 3'-phosphodiesterase